MAAALARDAARAAQAGSARRHPRAFVAGVSGEQFALSDAVRLLRETRRGEATGDLVAVSGADPLNLVGILLPGARIPALTGNRILYRDGVPVGAVVAGEVTWLMPIDAAAMREAEDMLIRTRADLTPAIAEGSVPDAA